MRTYKERQVIKQFVVHSEMKGILKKNVAGYFLEDVVFYEDKGYTTTPHVDSELTLYLGRRIKITIEELDE